MNNDKVIGLVILITVCFVVAVFLIKFLYDKSESFKSLIGLIAKFFGCIIAIVVIDEFTGLCTRYTAITLIIFGIIMILSVVKLIKAIVLDVQIYKKLSGRRTFMKNLKKNRKLREKRSREKLKQSKEFIKQYEDNQYKMR